MPPANALLVALDRLPAYDLGSDHPFAKDRLAPLVDLLRRMRLVEPRELLATDPASDEDLLDLHTAEYVETLKALGRSAPSPALLARAWRHGLGDGDNPIAPGQHEAAAAVAGATLACVRAVLAGTTLRAFNPAGGLHHAFADRASGFCLYNDLVLGIRAARAGGMARVLYVDYDVHHGDGVEAAFAGDPTVMTISFHQDPDTLFPGTGRIEDLGQGSARGTKVNVPLAPGTGDASWLAAVEALLPPLAERFRPELVVTQHGCDTHWSDPLAQLQLTTGAMLEAARLTRAVADRHCGGRWVATGGGGYQPYRVLARAFAMVWLVMSDRPVPERIDEGWLAAWSARSGGGLPEFFLDPRREGAGSPRAAETNTRTVTALRQLLGLA
ncbi:MAG: acetoin utilization protein AcuC [Planctomycetes bacterium]|nr:acetoin utilization protein AcuC [Planctomycetota bacterium]